MKKYVWIIISLLVLLTCTVHPQATRPGRFDLLKIGADKNTAVDVTNILLSLGIASDSVSVSGDTLIFWKNGQQLRHKILSNSIYSSMVAAQQVVKSLNNLHDNLSLIGGSGIDVNSNGVNALTLSISPGSIITSMFSEQSVTQSVIDDAAVGTNQLIDSSLTSPKIASNTLVRSINNLKDDLTLIAGEGINITSNGDDSLTIEATGGGGSGDITAVSAGPGLIGGGTSGDVELSVDEVDSTMIAAGAVKEPEIATGAIVPRHIGDDVLVKAVNGLNDSLYLVAGTNVSIASNGNDTLTIAAVGGGDITSVSAGTGLTGGGVSGDIEISVETGGITGSMLASGAAVTSVNSLTDAVTLAQGSNVTITPSGNTLTFATNADIMSVSAGSGLIGGGISGDVELSVDELDSTFIGPRAIKAPEIGDAAIIPRHIGDDVLVKTVNGLNDSLTLVAGSNVSITSNGVDSLTISTIGGGDITEVSAGTGLTGGGTTGAVELSIDNGGVTGTMLAAGAAVKSINSLTDAVTLAQGSNITITPSGNTLTIATTAGGDITAVTAGTGLEGGGTSGDVNLAIDPSQLVTSVNSLTDAVTLAAGNNISITPSAGTLTFATNADITGVTAGSGLTGGGVSGDVSLSIPNGGVTGAMLGAGAAVTSVNSLTDAISLSAGSNISITPSGNTLTFATNADITDVSAGAGLTGGGSSGSVELSVDNGGITGAMLASGAAVKSINSLTDAVTLAQGSNISITPSGNTLTIAATGGGDITAVSAGSGLTGGGTTGAVELSVGEIDSTMIGPRAVKAPEIADGAVIPRHLSSGTAVTAINSLTDAVTLSAGSNVSITPSGNTLTIASTGSGDITGVSAGTGLTGGGVSGDVELSIANSGVTGTMLASGAAVKSINTLTDAVTLAQGSNITITPAGNTLTFATSADITGVTAGAGLTGGGTSGGVTLSIGTGGIITSMIAGQSITQLLIDDDAVGPDQLAANTAVTSLNSFQDAVSIAGGNNISITNDANTITIDGITSYTDTVTIWFTGKELQDLASNSTTAASRATVTGTNANHEVLNFIYTANRYAKISFVSSGKTPIGTTIWIDLYWYAQGEATEGDVVWNAQVRGISENQDIFGAFSSAAKAQTTTAATQGYIKKSRISLAKGTGNMNNPGEFVMINFFRDTGDVGDTMEDTASLAAVAVKYLVTVDF